jgi:hypothetical protein
LITRSQKARLRELSARDDQSMATFVREAIEYYLRVAAGPAAVELRDQLLESVGSLPATPDDASQSRGYW